MISYSRNLVCWVMAMVLPLIVIMTVATIRTVAAAETANLWIVNTGGTTSCVRQPAPVTLASAPNNAKCSTFGAAYTAAAGGDLVLAMAGSYAGFQPGTKSSRVTMRAGNGETVTLGESVFGTGSKNLTLDGMSIDGIDSGAQLNVAFASNFTIQNSTITSQMAIRTNGGDHLNILIDHNMFEPWDKGGGSPAEGRLSVIWNGGPEGPGSQDDSGVTVSNNEFIGPGCSDGMQVSAAAVNIIGNTFHGLYQGNCSAHVDSIQLASAQRTVLRNNVFYSSDVGVMSYDGGGDHTLAENNAFRDIDRSDEYLGFGGEIEPTIRHNSLIGGAISISSKEGENGNPDQQTTDAIIYDNIAEEITVQCGQSTTTCGLPGTVASNHHNLLQSGATANAGVNNIAGIPTLAHASFTTLANAGLLNGSLGIGGASDGKDIGVDTTASGVILVGDIDEDGDVDNADLTLLKTDFGKTTGTATTPAADLNGDNKINIKDLSKLLKNWTG